MNKNKLSLSNSIIKKADRTNDGNLTEEARQRALKFFRKYLEHTGRVNISEISRIIGLSRQTTKNLIDEILAEWRQDMQDQAPFQAK